MLPRELCLEGDEAGHLWPAGRPEAVEGAEGGRRGCEIAPAFDAAWLQGREFSPNSRFHLSIPAPQAPAAKR